MYSNIGKKIMVFSKTVAWLGIAFSVLCGVVMIAGGSVNLTGLEQNVTLSKGAAVAAGIAVIVLGSLCSWISSWMMYGFGQLIQDTRKIADKD